MSTDTLTVVTNVGALVVAVAAVVVTLRGIRDQLRLATFTEFTKRYSEIMAKMPADARQIDGHSRLDEQLLGPMREYFNLCSEEWYLNVHEMIDQPAWDIWQKGMRSALRSPTFRAAWNRLERNYQSFEQFHEHYGKLVADMEKDPTGLSPGPASHRRLTLTRH